MYCANLSLCFLLTNKGKLWQNFKFVSFPHQSFAKSFHFVFLISRWIINPTPIGWSGPRAQSCPGGYANNQVKSRFLHGSVRMGTKRTGTLPASPCKIKTVNVFEIENASYGFLYCATASSRDLEGPVALKCYMSNRLSVLCQIYTSFLLTKQGETLAKFQIWFVLTSKLRHLSTKTPAFVCQSSGICLPEHL